MERKEKLKQLIEKYNSIKLENSEMKKISSEEFYRVWINEFLKIFNWDVKNLNHVIQEKKIEKKSQEKLNKIGSTHIKPDYTLVNGKIKKAYLDAKDISVNLFKDSKLARESAYQIKCYGWSTNLPCSFITNFEQLVIYDCQNIPNLQDSIDVGGTFIKMEEYIDRFDELDKLLLRDNIINGSLDRIYTSKKINGNRTLDNNFNIFLCEFRLELAKNLVKNNKKIEEDEELLNYYTQVILDRIIFIRFCEGKELEKEGLLYEFLNSGKFWDNFKKSCYLEFYNHYDGAMFNIDLEFQKLELENIIFEKFIPQLYYPYPYKFDVIPTKILSNIYEDFLGTTLFLKNKIVCEDLKPDYIKSKGAIATPAYIVEEICKNTIDLDKYNNVNDILNLKIFDPCCGSGIFLIVAYEMICSKIKELLNIEENKKNVEKKYWIEYNNKIEITVPMKVKIISECLHSIDYDDVAIEVTKMSLALKIIDDYEKIIYPDVGIYGSKILSGIDKNIILGNTLFDLNKNEFNAHLVEELKIIDFQKKETFYDVFNKKNGFDYIIGNPPYVETKHYKKSSSEMHSYLNQLYNCFHMKADLSILFLERCISLLNEKGKLGFIIQRRWFKADYGKEIRNFISKNNLLEKLYDINTSNIFLGRTTYVSIMV
ncbi:Eco57I restriction-modification methylase domain-containing protein, partial [Cetobacterium sp.]|uniref:Eco57I restriction-modification methylase domain-containing protein n=1 Tax=Cetobacterium sp. TaxID=2071632 RepID=UPI003EE65605